MKPIYLAFVKNPVFVNLLMVIIIGVGLFASQSMVREMFPEISVDTLMVTIIYPGADPEEVEEGISRKVEEAIDGIEGIKRYTTVSSENAGRAVIEVKESHNIDDVYTDVRNAIDSISSFPVDAEKPIITELTIMSDVLQIALWGDQSEKTLKELAEEIKDDVQGLPSISQVGVLGTRDYEIAIEVSEERLREYGLTFGQVAAAVRRGSINLSGGVLRTKGEEIRLRTVGRKYSGKEFASIIVLARPNGETITLDRIADIKDGFTEDPIYATFNGEECVIVTVRKTEEEDAIAISSEVKEYLDKKQAALPGGMHLTQWSDFSPQIQARIDLLVSNGIQGFLLVFILLWLFLDFRLSFWVSMGVPLSFGGALIIMWIFGASLNQLSLFSLIMVSGMLVDDAIVVGEAIYVHRKRGDGPIEAAVNGVMEVGLPVVGAVTTTIIAFLPLMFVAGVMGKFIAIIPLGVIACLVVSLFESLFMLPAHLSHLPDPKKASEKQNIADRIHHFTSNGLEYFIDRVYYPLVQRCVKYRYISASVAASFFLFTMGLVAGGFVEFVVFSANDGNDIVANVEFPRGTPAGVTQEAMVRTEDALNRLVTRLPKKDDGPIVKNVFSISGAGRGASPFEGESGTHIGQIRVELVDGPLRLMRSKEIQIAWEEETGKIPGAILQSFEALEQGPPGAPIEVRLRGENLDNLRAIADEIKAKLETYKGVYQISDTFRPGKNELRFDLKPEARTLGITLEDLARQVYAGFFGEEALRLQRGRDDIRVRVRYTDDERATLAELEKVRIRTPNGMEVPFFSVASVRFSQGFSNITRIDGQKAISVTAENDEKQVNADKVLAEIGSTLMPELERRYAGFTWSFEGAKTDSRDAFAGLVYGFPVALFGIYLIIATIFRSYLQPLLIMVAIPFSILGAIYGHLAMGLTLTMFSIFGMVALAGVVVNDGIVLIEAVNTMISGGMKVMDAICKAGVRRFRAIFLTSSTTVGGLLPLVFEKDFQAQFVIPMALSLASGVALATVLTLVFVPCLIHILNDIRRVLRWVATRRWPTPEEVEPAHLRTVDPREHMMVDEPILAK